MKVLVDTNIVLDMVLKRADFYQDAYEIFKLVDQKRIIGCLSAASITDIFYLLRKDRYNANEVYIILDELIDLFSIAPVFEKTIADALSLRWKDFEDAVQYTVAKENGITHIITRNKSDFSPSSILCMTPADFITYIGS
ncbi:MAG: PIN domain-containing protein [Treponema sp.]|nr:PIN domain-containing protein [Treponema sp.]